MYTPRERRPPLMLTMYLYSHRGLRLYLRPSAVVFVGFHPAVTPFDKAGRLVLVPRSARAN